MNTPGDDDVQYSSDDSLDQILHQKISSEHEELPNSQPNTYVLEVRRLSRNVNSDHLKEIFGKHGTVLKAECVEYKHVHIGLGLVHFLDENEMKNAMNYLDGVCFLSTCCCRFIYI
jgi:RNA recognition motif-containing protein